VAREFRFPVEIEWAGGRKTVAVVGDKEPLVVATPPEFAGTDPEAWSPEDAFVTAAGSCLAVTIVALAEREALPLLGLDVRADGVVSRRADGRFGFTRIEQTVEIETAPGHEDAARRIVERAEESCLVSVSLDLPTETTVDVRAVEAAA